MFYESDALNHALFVLGEATEIRIPVPYGHIAGKVTGIVDLDVMTMFCPRPGVIPVVNPSSVFTAGLTMQEHMTTSLLSSMR